MNKLIIISLFLAVSWLFSACEKKETTINEALIDVNTYDPFDELKFGVIFAEIRDNVLKSYKTPNEYTLVQTDLMLSELDLFKIKKQTIELIHKGEETSKVFQPLTSEVNKLIDVFNQNSEKLEGKQSLILSAMIAMLPDSDIMNDLDKKQQSYVMFAAMSRFNVKAWYPQVRECMDKESLCTKNQEKSVFKTLDFCMKNYTNEVLKAAAEIADALRAHKK